MLEKPPELALLSEPEDLCDGQMERSYDVGKVQNYWLKITKKIKKLKKNTIINIENYHNTFYYNY